MENNVDWMILYKIERNKLFSNPPSRFKDAQPIVDYLFSLIPTKLDFIDPQLGTNLQSLYRKDIDYIEFKNRNK